MLAVSRWISVINQIASRTIYRRHLFFSVWKLSLFIRFGTSHIPIIQKLNSIDSVHSSCCPCRSNLSVRFFHFLLFSQELELERKEKKSVFHTRAKMIFSPKIHITDRRVNFIWPVMATSHTLISSRRRDHSSIRISSRLSRLN